MNPKLQMRLLKFLFKMFPRQTKNEVNFKIFETKISEHFVALQWFCIMSPVSVFPGLFRVEAVSPTCETSIYSIIYTNAGYC